MNISKPEALSILNITEQDEALDAYEELLFKWKQKYLGTLPPIKILQAHILKISRVQKAGMVLLNFKSVKLTFNAVRWQHKTLKEVLSEYQPNLMAFKFQISNADSADVLIQILEALIEVQRHLLKKVATYCPTNDAAVLKEVKISSPSDFHSVLKELIEKDISETEIMDYLRTELKFGHYPFESVLLNEVLKAKKQVE